MSKDRSEAMGQRLQDLRLAKGLSQSQLAKLAGVPTSSLKNWEQGRREPLLSAARQLALALGITLDTLAHELCEPTPTGQNGTGRAEKPAPGGQGRKRKGKG